MSAPNTIPCDKLSFEALVARVASTMDASGLSHPSYPMQPGRCRFCGHGLPYSYSATGVGTDGAIHRIEWNEGDAIAEKLNFNDAHAVHLGAGLAFVHSQRTGGVRVTDGLRHIGQHFPDVLLAANGCCEAVTSEVMKSASQKVAAKTAAIRRQQQLKARAHAIVEKRDVARAAAALSKQPPAPAPDDGQF